MDWMFDLHKTILWDEKMDGHLNFQVDKNNGKWGVKVLYKIQVYFMGTDDNKYTQILKNF